MTARPVPVALTRELLQQMPLPLPGGNTDKNERGKAVIAGASPLSAGAVTLSGVAAFRAGAGKVTLALPQMLAGMVGVAFPEAGVLGFATSAAGHPVAREASAQIAELAHRCDALLVGPGLADEASARELILGLLTAVNGPAIVVDALALTGLWNMNALVREHAGRVVITPHAGEMAALMDISRAAVEHEPESVAQRAADHLGCVVVLKGASTVIAQPQGERYRHDAGVPGLAISGSGDVLAGVLVGLLARGATPVQAALHSVFLHAQAGHVLTRRIGSLGFLASELPAEIPMLMDGLVRAAHD